MREKIPYTETPIERATHVIKYTREGVNSDVWFSTYAIKVNGVWYRNSYNAWILLESNIEIKAEYNVPW